MATALTPGYIYLIESEKGVDDWITDHSGDPDLIDLDNFSVGNNSEEGKGYVKIQIPKNIQKAFNTGIRVSDMVGGKSYDIRWQKRFYQTMARGIETSIANADLIEEFIMSDRHTAGDSATFKRYYMIVYFGVNIHLKFTDASGNRQSYCRGVVLGGIMNWIDKGKADLTAIIQINFRSVW